MLMLAVDGCSAPSQGQPSVGAAPGVAGGIHDLHNHQVAADTDCTVGELSDGGMMGGGLLHLFYVRGHNQVLPVDSVAAAVDGTSVAAFVAEHTASAPAALVASAAAVALVAVAAAAVVIITAAVAAVNIAVVVGGMAAEEGWHRGVVGGRMVDHPGHQPCVVGPGQSCIQSDMEWHWEGWTCQWADGQSCRRMRMKIVEQLLFECQGVVVDIGVVSCTHGWCWLSADPLVGLEF